MSHLNIFSHLFLNKVSTIENQNSFSICEDAYPLSDVEDRSTSCIRSGKSRAADKMISMFPVIVTNKNIDTAIKMNEVSISVFVISVVSSKSNVIFMKGEVELTSIFVEIRRPRRGTPEMCKL
ncbi:hypothetical protein ACOME3_005479 [Neoechinorhynchus agilis]